MAATKGGQEMPRGKPEQTYYRWKKTFGGLRMDQAKRLKELETENSRLKRLLADAELDKAILRGRVAGSGGGERPPAARGVGARDGGAGDGRGGARCTGVGTHPWPCRRDAHRR